MKNVSMIFTIVEKKKLRNKDATTKSKWMKERTKS